jgi:hypothetical protein
MIVRLQICAKDHVRFQMMYTNILKVHMDGLKRTKKKKKSERSSIG